MFQGERGEVPGDSLQNTTSSRIPPSGAPQRVREHGRCLDHPQLRHQATVAAQTSSKSQHHSLCSSQQRSALKAPVCARGSPGCPGGGERPRITTTAQAGLQSPTSRANMARHLGAPGLHCTDAGSSLGSCPPGYALVKVEEGDHSHPQGLREGQEHKPESPRAWSRSQCTAFGETLPLLDL